MTSSPLVSTLEAVTVYREGAVCRRTAKVPPAPGTEVRLAGLPLSLDPGSLRAFVVSGEPRVIGIRADFAATFLEAVDLPQEAQALARANETLDRLQAARGRLNQECRELESLRPSFVEPRKGDPPREAHVPALLALGDFVQAELAGRLATRRTLEQEIEEAQREVALRQRRLQEAGSALGTDRARLFRVAVITLSQPATTEMEMALEYRVPGARWVPSYQLRLSPGLTEGALSLRASVAQHTGEDWTQVRLALSTAHLDEQRELPELRSLRLGRAQPAPPKSGWREPPPGLDDLFEGYDALAHGTSRAPTRTAPVPPKRKPMPMPAPPPPVAMALECAAAPEMAPMAAPARRSRAPLAAKMAVADAEPPEEAFEAPDDPGPPAAPTPPEHQLDYPNLCLAGPEDPQRGRLRVRVTQRTFAFLETQVEWEAVEGLVERARQHARRLPDLPAGTQPVAAVDAFDYRFDCQAPATVPSTDRWVNLAVMECPVDCFAEYRCVPAVEPKAYRILRLHNRSAHALLPGPLDVLLGGEFLLTTHLAALGPHAKASTPLGLGVEEAIHIRRETHFKETTGGLLGGSTLLQHTVVIDLQNHLATPLSMEVLERVPFIDSEHEKTVKLEETLVEPPWVALDEVADPEQRVRGGRRWRAAVPAGKEQTLRAEYTLRIPSDTMVVGGNRRD